MTELERARADLADAEASLVAGTNPYAEQNVSTFRARVARLEAAAPRTPAVASIPTTPAVPSPKAPPAPVIAGTREERLRRIAVAFDTDEATLEAAIDEGISPDEFAMIASDEAAAKAKAHEILNA